MSFRRGKNVIKLIDPQNDGLQKLSKNGSVKIGIYYKKKRG